MRQRVRVSCFVLIISSLCLTTNLVAVRAVRSRRVTYDVKKFKADKSDMMTKPLRDLSPDQPRAGGAPREAEPVRTMKIKPSPPSPAHRKHSARIRKAPHPLRRYSPTSTASAKT